MDGLAAPGLATAAGAGAGEATDRKPLQIID